MRRLLAIVSGLVLLAASAWAGDEPRVKPIDPLVVERTRATLEKALAGDEAAWAAGWFDTVAFAYPRLWRAVAPRLGDTHGLNLIATKLGGEEGRTFKGKIENARLAAALWPLVHGGQVRRLTPAELRQYWNLFPFDELVEPIFVVTAQGNEILVHLVADQAGEHFTAFFMDALRLAAPAPGAAPQATQRRSAEIRPSNP